MPSSRLTTGFFRGTPGSIMNDCVEHLKSEFPYSAFPMLVPMIVLSHEMNEDKVSNAGTQCSRQLLLNVEETISNQDSIDPLDQLRILNNLEKDLLIVHKQVIEKHPQPKLGVIKGLERTAQEFSALNPFALIPSFQPWFHKEQQRMNGALTFYRAKLEGISADVTVTLSRIEMLRSAIQNSLSAALANSQKRSDDLKHNIDMNFNKRQYTFSVLGVLFLPGTFFAVSLVL
jgi:Mg2+ and Co2+ transporter CorA